jgi:hydrogenase-4 component B
VLNHSLFKSLLFFNAGSIYQAAHSRNIEQLGGLMKRMPHTAIFFLTGSLAICGLPPFNGFISEYLIYLGMFKSLSAANLDQSIIVLVSLTGLALIGGLAIFCFTKAFGIVFLGEPRSENAANACEVKKIMIYPQYIILAFILLIGLASIYFVRPVFKTIANSFAIADVSSVTGPSISNLTQISILSGIFVLIIIGLLVYRHFHLKTRRVETGPTWGCGYTAASSKLQYTATSYADNYVKLANPLLHSKTVTTDFESHNQDSFKKYLIDKPVNLLLELLKKIAVMQTGQIQHYILYLFVYMLILFLLSYFNVI